MKKIRKILGLLLLVLSLAAPSSVPVIGTVQTVSAARLNYKKLKLKKGKKKKLRLKYYSGKVTWKSKNRRIASVSKSGVVKAKRVGTTTITATTASGKVYRCKVTVKAASSGSSSSGSSSSSGAKQTATVWLSATGTKYHRISNCGKMNPAKARQVTLSKAISLGYEACSKCY